MPSARATNSGTLANRDLGAVDQHRGVDRFMIDVRVVEAVEVDEQELSVLQPKLDVVAANGDVIEEDVAVRMPARRCDGLIEQELGNRRWGRASRVAGPSDSAGRPRSKRGVQHLRRPGRSTRREGER